MISHRKIVFIAAVSLASFFLSIIVGGILVHFGIINMYLERCPVGDAIAIWMATSVVAFFGSILLWDVAR